MKKADEIWVEEDLVKRFYFTQRKQRSRQIGHWIAKGLKYIRLSGKRFFREEDIVSFFNQKNSS